MGGINFAECKVLFTENATNQELYGWKGSTQFIERNTTSQISWQGCEQLCGSGVDFYDWPQIASTITTWVLPIIGIILQAPFESNAFSATLLALCRWIGNPIASLSYILWNIKVTGKCALFVDTAFPVHQDLHDADFKDFRDSLFILTTMNQFETKRKFPREWKASINKVKSQAEGLLRMVLFSKDLELKESKQKELSARRRDLAQTLRDNRKRGVVPVYISTMWFLCSLAISIQSSFGELGVNAAAHDLGLGLLLAWLPVLILSSIVDRNSLNAERIRKKLNTLVDHVRNALLDDEICEKYCATIQHSEGWRERERHVREIARACPYLDNYFVSFAGQGRVRWHYGAAHSILTSIERSYIAEKGRGWLAYDEQEARNALALGTVAHGLLYFDFRELWQIVASVLIVTFTVAGAWVISFFTPTVGLGCRSGGYLIFWLVSLSLTILEMSIWALVPAITWEESPATLANLSGFKGYARRFVTRVAAVFNAIDNAVTKTNMFLRRVFFRSHQSQLDRLEIRLEHRMQARKNHTLQDLSDIYFFRPIEAANTGWLTYIVLAQTAGIYQTCKCMSSLWGIPGSFGYGGYTDFNQFLVSNERWLRYTWAAATGVASGVMGVAMIYIVIEWCLQSHISTEDFEDACNGLWWTRQFRRATFPYRWIYDVVINLARSMAFRLRKLLGMKTMDQNRQRRSLLWTYHVTRTDISEGLAQRGSVNLHTSTERNRLLSTSSMTKITPTFQITKPRDDDNDIEMQSPRFPASGYWRPRHSRQRSSNDSASSTSPFPSPFLIPRRPVNGREARDSLEEEPSPLTLPSESAASQQAPVGSSRDDVRDPL